MSVERGIYQLRSLWPQILDRIPEEFPEGDRKILRGYFRAQLRISCGQKVKARNILFSLGGNKRFIEMEERNPDLLAAIDVAVRGQTNRLNGINNPIKPLFTLNDN